MRWVSVVAGTLILGSMALEANALSLPGLEPPAEAEGHEADLPALANLILPPHLAGGFPRALPRAAKAVDLPTLRDMDSAAPAYEAPPPQRQRKPRH